ncbi:hypothetical protein ABZX56_24980 [Streptomyces parvulus]|uniref:Uncharacterized protein n=1 Tax=Streptomyces parvulus TaxID=146923 RepID=A0A369UTX6_9ACTN|nr:hypothetical protein [Streptomyces parvulus]RDD83907.1 hypothetical protein DVZ84_37995 [Streptomyces parvulus]
MDFSEVLVALAGAAALTGVTVVVRGWLERRSKKREAPWDPPSSTPPGPPLDDDDWGDDE